VLVNHERGAKLYGTTAYFISSVLSSIPIQLYLAQIYATVKLYPTLYLGTITNYIPCNRLFIGAPTYGTILSITQFLYQNTLL